MDLPEVVDPGAFQRAIPRASSRWPPEKLGNAKWSLSILKNAQQPLLRVLIPVGTDITHRRDLPKITNILLRKRKLRHHIPTMGTHRGPAIQKRGGLFRTTLLKTSVYNRPWTPAITRHF